MRFYIHKLGCPKNDVDADYIAARLIDAGGEPSDNPDNADVIIVNTCGFILTAKEESINEILKLSKLKESGREKRLLVTGCLSQRYGKELLKDIPEIDGAFGIGELDALVQAIGNQKRVDTPQKIETRFLSYIDYTNRYISDTFPYAYLKISDGCNRRCSYCAIPSIRGDYRSRPMEAILKEAEYLSHNGKKELIVVSQDSTMWGSDLPGTPSILNLLQELDKLDNVKWIRLMYLHPAGLHDNLIEYMTDPRNKTLSYFDIPLQHINNRILSEMKRKVTKEKIEGILSHIRKLDKNATIRTTFIVGFPGETSSEFDELADFIEKWEFDRMGVFPYSMEEGTLAESLKGHLPERTKSKRVDALMIRQQEIAFKKNDALVGQELEIVIDSISEDGIIGRTKGDCPDIDQLVYIAGENVSIGDIHKARITSADGYDLRGTIVKE